MNKTLILGSSQFVLSGNFSDLLSSVSSANHFYSARVLENQING